jgi:hypothetical protein
MAFAVKIEEGKYGSAIMLLVRMGGSFQTAFERTLIVNAEQKHALEEAGFIKATDSGTKQNGKKKKTK